MTRAMVCLSLALAANAAADLRFEVRYAAGLRTAPLDGRLLVMLSTDQGAEPRFQIDTSLDTQQMFGADVNGLEAGEAAVLDGSALGYPVERLEDVPAGEYFVQALVHVYETFHRSDGRVLKLPMDDGEGQQWERSPGNLFSTPTRLHIDPETDQVVSLTLDQVIPPIDPPADTKYIKHVRIQSEKLSRFWGRPMHLGAIVLLPEGFDQHPEARYPVLYVQGHFTSTFRGFQEHPPARGLEGDAKMEAEHAYRFYQDWTSGRLPRMLIVISQHANPYYDDSYGVNSENLGPYGDAIIEELTPYVEKKFRAIGEGWARVLMGGSTGGWIALAQQVFYPDFFNGAWCHCPDSVDFREYQMVNVYENENAYWMDSEWKKVPRVDRREVNGDLTATMEDANRFELVLGENARSGGQWDIWQAVYGPVGQEGYPQPIWNKRTGKIDREVADYWKENYDLRAILERRWAKLGPKLVGKIHIKMGDVDHFYLERAVRLLEAFLESTKEPGRGPYYGGSIEYGDGHGHCYTGDPSVPTRMGRLTIYQRHLPVMAEHMLKTAPPGADVTSWRY
ncbi:MAG TPA: alpha/beta hydrolase-fold protein [Vicinamibacteria bacterium]